MCIVISCRLLHMVDICSCKHAEALGSGNHHRQFVTLPAWLKVYFRGCAHVGQPCKEEQWNPLSICIATLGSALEGPCLADLRP